MNTQAITHNDQLLGHIEKQGNHWVAIVCGDEIYCATKDEAIQTIYDINPAN
jgi:hypothetical protein